MQVSVVTFWIERDRQPGVCFVRKIEAVGHHSNHRARVPFDFDRLADDCRISAEAPLPQSMTQDHRRAACRSALAAEHEASCLVWQKRTSQHWLHLECVEQTPGDSRDADAIRLRAARQVAGLCSGVRCHLGAALTLVAPLDIIGPGYGVDPCSTTAWFGSGEDRHQAVSLSVRQGPQQHAVDYAEDRACRAYAQREHQDHDRAEARPLEQHSDAVTKVLKHLILQSSWL